MQHFDLGLKELFTPESALSSLKALVHTRKSNLWLVGGALRDLLRGEERIADIDICSSVDPTPLAQTWAKTVSGRWFWLDENRKQSRVLLPNRMTVDFSPLRASSIEEDLIMRDFTINSMALPFSPEMSYANLLDPLQGQIHLREKRLVLCSPHSIAEDPLRMLKGIRHAVSLNLTLDTSLLSAFTDSSALLDTVAAERIRDELGMILSSVDPVGGLKLLDETGLLARLLGSPVSSWNTDKCFEKLTALTKKMREFERKSAEQGVRELYNSRSLFLLATLFSDYAPGNIETVLHEKLRLSRHQQKLIGSLLEPPGSKWLDQVKLASTSRQKALLVEKLGYFQDEQLLYFSVCKELLPLEVSRNLLAAFYEHQRLGRVPDLLSGHKLRSMLHGHPESEIGRWLRLIKDAEIIGEISGEEEIFHWLKSKLSN